MDFGKLVQDFQPDPMPDKVPEWRAKMWHNSEMVGFVVSALARLQEEQNGRVRKNGKNIARLAGIVSVLVMLSMLALANLI